MSPRGSRAVTLLAVAVLVGTGAACGPAAPGLTAAPRIATFAEFFGTWCSSMQSMLRAIGNPDTGTDSQLGKALDAAIEAGDLVSVDAVSNEIRIELQDGRRLAASAGTWPPGAQMASQTERVLAAFDAAIVAKQSAARAGPQKAEEEAQAAFEQAGGREAWTGMLEAARGFPELARADGPSCPGITG
jgi:hypothetical protein